MPSCQQSGTTPQARPERHVEPLSCTKTGVRRADVECVFCAILAGRAAAHFVHRDEEVAAFLDRRPLFFGHVLVVPVAHLPSFFRVDSGTVLRLFTMARDLSEVMRTALGAEGAFVALNDTVSQSVPHVHVHVVPRRRGDGLRGFFWPRRRYESDEIAAEYATRLAEGLRQLIGKPDG